MVKSLLKTEPNKCYWCGREGATALHHIYPGNPRRKFSTEDGMIVFLCPRCHTAAHETNSGILREIQKDGQEAWEQTYGDREAFIQRYGKSYLWEEEQ